MVITIEQQGKTGIVIFDRDIAKKLFEKEFYGKSFGEGLQLSLVEALYLSQKGFIDIQTTDGKKVSKEKLAKTIHKLQPRKKKCSGQSSRTNYSSCFNVSILDS